jgi:hypothetical protein
MEAPSGELPVDQPAGGSDPTPAEAPAGNTGPLPFDGAENMVLDAY